MKEKLHNVILLGIGVSLVLFFGAGLAAAVGVESYLATAVSGTGFGSALTFGGLGALARW